MRMGWPKWAKNGKNGKKSIFLRENQEMRVEITWLLGKSRKCWNINWKRSRLLIWGDGVTHWAYQKGWKWKTWQKWQKSIFSRENKEMGVEMTKLLGKSRKYMLIHTIKEIMIIGEESWGHPWGSPKRMKWWKGQKWQKSSSPRENQKMGVEMTRLLGKSQKYMLKDTIKKIMINNKGVIGLPLGSPKRVIMVEKAKMAKIHFFKWKSGDGIKIDIAIGQVRKLHA